MLTRQSQLRQQNARTQGRTFLNADMVLLKKPYVGGDLEVSGLLARHDTVKAESADVVDLVKTYVTELNGRLRLLGSVRQMVIFKQVHIRRLRPVAALEFKTHGLTYRQERKVVLPDGRSGEVDRLTVLRLDEA